MHRLFKLAVCSMNLYMSNLHKSYAHIQHNTHNHDSTDLEK